MTVGGITFTGLEPADQDHPLSVSITLPSGSLSSPTTADISVTYGSGPGSRVETFRKVSLAASDSVQGSPNYANYITQRIGTVAGTNASGVTQPANYVSTLVAVSPDTTTIPISYRAVLCRVPCPSGRRSGARVHPVTDFGPVFATDGSLDKVPDFQPDVPSRSGGLRNPERGGRICEAKEAFLIVDCKVTDGVHPTNTQNKSYVGDSIGLVPASKNAALYFPYLQLIPGDRGLHRDPPGGTVARNLLADRPEPGVWKAPAGLETAVINVVGVVERGQMSNPRQGVLNGLGVNCPRDFPGVGTCRVRRRTVVSTNLSQQDSKYVPVRRMTLFIEQSLFSHPGLGRLRAKRRNRSGPRSRCRSRPSCSPCSGRARCGTTPVRRSRSSAIDQTTSQSDIDNGIVNIVVAFAPLKPAEFVIIQIAQLAGQAQSAA